MQHKKGSQVNCWLAAGGGGGDVVGGVDDGGCPTKYTAMWWGTQETERGRRREGDSERQLIVELVVTTPVEALRYTKLST